MRHIEQIMEIDYKLVFTDFVKWLLILYVYKSWINDMFEGMRGIFKIFFPVGASSQSILALMV